MLSPKIGKKAWLSSLTAPIQCFTGGLASVTRQEKETNDIQAGKGKKKTISIHNDMFI